MQATKVSIHVVLSSQLGFVKMHHTRQRSETYHTLEVGTTRLKKFVIRCYFILTSYLDK